MGLDRKVGDSIRQAVRDAKQSDEVANKIIAWLEALTGGNENLADRDATIKRLELLYSTTKCQDRRELEE